MILCPFLVLYDGKSYKFMNVIYKTVRTIYTIFSFKQSLFILGKIRNLED